MFLLKFDGFDSTNSTKNHIGIKNNTFIYNVTIGYDDTISKRIVLMKDVSSSSTKKNDCIIEMDNLQGFIMQDFILFMQINIEKKGVLNFKNWVQSSAASTNHIPQSYDIDIIHSDRILHFAKLSLIRNGSNVANKVEVLQWGSYEKENQKLSINDFELAVNSLELNMGFIENQEKDKEIKKLRARLIDASNEITNLQEKLKNCDDKPTVPITIDFSKHIARYVLSEPMQKYSFGNSLFHVPPYPNNHRYTANLKDQNEIKTFWDSFETVFLLKKENLLIAETPYTIVDGFLDVTTDSEQYSGSTKMQYYNLFAINIEKLADYKYKIIFRNGRPGFVASQGIVMDTIAVYDEPIVINQGSPFFNESTQGDFPAYSFTIENIVIKTDKIFALDDIEKSEYTADGVKRFIEFEYDLLKLPVVTNVEFIGDAFPKLFAILKDWVIQ